MSRVYIPKTVMLNGTSDAQATTTTTTKTKITFHGDKHIYMHANVNANANVCLNYTNALFSLHHDMYTYTWYICVEMDTILVVHFLPIFLNAHKLHFKRQSLSAHIHFSCDVVVFCSFVIDAFTALAIHSRASLTHSLFSICFFFLSVRHNNGAHYSSLTATILNDSGEILNAYTHINVAVFTRKSLTQFLLKQLMHRPQVISSLVALYKNVLLYSLFFGSIHSLITCKASLHPRQFRSLQTVGKESRKKRKNKRNES